MIIVNYDTDSLCVDVRGHAGAGEYGEDLVCAAASTLANTLIEALKDKKELIREQSLEYDNGCFRLSVKPKTEYCVPPIRAVFDAVCAGFYWMAGAYPDYIRYDKWGGDKL